MTINTRIATMGMAAALGLASGGLFGAPHALASSHMDAPGVTDDDAANTTDVYAFVSDSGGTKYLTTALAVYPFEEPGIGPNKYNFSDDVLYQIHVALGDDVAAGRATLSYQFRFKTEFQNENTILQSFQPQASGVAILEVGDDAQNLIQRYEVRVFDRRKKKRRSTLLGSGIVPPNNQGRVTPLYNSDAGEGPALDGVSTAGDLDAYTQQAIATLADGYVAFAGQRDDGFYADIQSVFDALNLRTGTEVVFDSQGGFNVHTIALSIPVAALGGDMQVAGVYATTSRQRITVRRAGKNDRTRGGWVQVARQGNPLFCEAFVPVAKKDLYNQTSPADDRKNFGEFARTPELAKLVNIVLNGGEMVVREDGRSDLEGLFAPDLIRVDLSTGPARLAGGGEDHATNPDDTGFSRLSVFGPGGGDVLFSALQQTDVPGGFPNGRRFGDDVLDIALRALFLDPQDPTVAAPGPEIDLDNVSSNDIAYSKVFPYAATPHNGRNHPHHGE